MKGSWWERHYKDENPVSLSPYNLCERCRDGYPEEDGKAFYCMKKDEIRGITTGCELFEKRHNRVTLSGEEVRGMIASHNPLPDTEDLCEGCIRYKMDPRNKGSYYCCGLYGPDVIEKGRKACGQYYSQKQREEEDRIFREEQEKRRLAEWEKNKDNPPRPAKFVRERSDITGELMGALPFCPNCDNPLYEHEQCYFCGQKIIQDEALAEYLKPAPLEYMDCFGCRGKGTFEFVRSKFNGHKHGKCKVCGMVVIE